MRLEDVTGAGEELLHVGIHAGGRLAGPNRTYDRDSGVETALSNGQPRRHWCALAVGQVVQLAKEETEIQPRGSRRVRRKPLQSPRRVGATSQDVDHRGDHGEEQERGAAPDGNVAVRWGGNNVGR